MEVKQEEMGKEEGMQENWEGGGPWSPGPAWSGLQPE